MEDEYILLARIQRLDPEALVEAHDTYYSPIFRYIAFRVGDQMIAEDLASDVFVRLLSAVRDRNAPRKTLRGWLYAVASRVVADHFRQQYRDGEREIVQDYDAIQEVVDGAADPSESVSHKQTLLELKEALAELTQEQQEVIALRFGQTMKIRDVAQTIGKSEGAVKQLQARAITALSRKLGGWGQQP